MPNPIIRIHDAATNEIIDREMTAAELKKYQSDIEENTARAKKSADEAVAKQAILARLGLTAEEAALLLS